MNPQAIKLHFRKMELEDIEIVHQIDVESFSLPWPKNSFAHELNNKDISRLWVVEAQHEKENPQVVGMLGGWLIVDEFHIGTIAVKKEFRRQHIGEAFLIHAIGQVFQEGVKSIFLEVRESNLAAQSMYEKMGFQVEGRRARYYSDNHEDAIIMNLRDLDLEKINSWQQIAAIQG